MSGYIRAHIRLNNVNEANDFVSKLNSTGSVDYFLIEDEAGIKRANARSLQSVINALTDYADEMYFVNDDEDGSFPGFIDEYRVVA